MPPDETPFGLMSSLGLLTWTEGGVTHGRAEPLQGWYRRDGTLRISALAFLADVVGGMPPTGAINPTVDLFGCQQTRNDDGARQDDEQPVDRRHDEGQGQITNIARATARDRAVARSSGIRIDRRAGGCRWTGNIPKLCG